MISVGFVKGLHIGSIVFGSRVENVLILGGPYPVGNFFVIMEVSDDNRLTANGSWGFNVAFVCVGDGYTLAVDVGGCLGNFRGS
jgi:hypothetical protein